MMLLKKRKDGGPHSTVTGYWLFEIKSFLSIAILKFEEGSREAFHNHAFDAVSWILKGHIKEYLGHPDDEGNFVIDDVRDYKGSLKPVITLREDFHKVVAVKPTWAITFRGPWADEWEEFLPKEGERVTLTHGRLVKNKS